MGTHKNSLAYILMEKSLATSYNGFSHTQSFLHEIFFISRFANMSVVLILSNGYLQEVKANKFQFYSEVLIC